MGLETAGAHLALLGVVGGSLGWVRGGSCGLRVLGLAVHGWLLTGGWSILNTYCGFREAPTRYLNVTMQIWISPRSSELGLKEQIVKLLKRTEEEKLDIPGPVVEVRKIYLPAVVDVVARLRLLN